MPISPPGTRSFCSLPMSPAPIKSIDALIGKIEAEMLADGISLNLCRYSDEPFNTNEIIWPHWSMAPFHPPTAMMAGAAFAVLSIAVWGAWPRRSVRPLRGGVSA